MISISSCSEGVAAATNGAAGAPAGTTECMATSTGALAPRGSFAAPLEWGGGGVPATHGRREPSAEVVRALGLVAGQGPADDDTLDRLGQVQPGAAQRGVERHPPLGAQ